jgi:hypothetical protein
METANDFVTEMLGLYNRLKSEAEEYIDREAKTRAAGITVCAAHRWAVVIDEPDCGNAVSYKDRQYCLKGVKGHLCGTSLFTKRDAEMVAADWASKAPASLAKVKIMLDIDLVRARLAHATDMIARFERGVVV